MTGKEPLLISRLIQLAAIGLAYAAQRWWGFKLDPTDMAAMAAAVLGITWPFDRAIVYSPTTHEAEVAKARQEAANAVVGALAANDLHVIVPTSTPAQTYPTGPLWAPPETQ